MIDQQANHAPVKRNPTIVDIAISAGVSIRTVSRVISGSSCVNTKTRQRVEAEIARAAFQPNRRARAMAAGRSFLVGVIESSDNPVVVGELQSGLLTVASAAGYEIVVHPVPANNSDPAANVLDFVRRSRVDGVIVLPPISELEQVAGQLRGMGLPAVGVAAAGIPGYPAVLLSDEEGAAAQVVQHLVAKGHRKIALVTGPSTQLSSQKREAGFRAALRRSGLSLAASHRVQGDYSYESGRKAGDCLLEDPDPPTAVFSCSDLMAAGLIGAALKRGLTLPRDLSVVGFGDSSLASIVWPPLTSVRLPCGDLGCRAMDRLLALIDGRADGPRDEIVRLSLVSRASTDSPATPRTLKSA